MGGSPKGPRKDSVSEEDLEDKGKRRTRKLGGAERGEDWGAGGGMEEGSMWGRGGGGQGSR